ncbi:protein BOLA4, chloroplastic/mitochondrial [Pistacia vera]|uniref:protein BOLA4, chloroplastic/mitochondrial n=1 Tax=Pistacia vera TaxID=55513 RepID=UPI0012634D98|nr:protein BOLA4, chloroplastic/mitochondrial [Pistacia vera]
MAKTLMSRPYIFSSSSRSFCGYFLSKTRILVNESFLLSCNSSSRNKLQIHGNCAIASNSSRFGFVGHRRFTTKATHVNDAGSIDSPLMQSMEKKIKESLNAESVFVKDAYGDGRHVRIDVISSAFEGQSAVNRQRMVYKAIWEELQSTVHAVDQMTTRTPAEAETQK